MIARILGILSINPSQKWLQASVTCISLFLRLESPRSITVLEPTKDCTNKRSCAPNRSHGPRPPEKEKPPHRQHHFIVDGHREDTLDQNRPYAPPP